MIKFVYFDVGGVAIRDFSGTNKFREMKKVLGVHERYDKDFDKLCKKYEDNGLNLNFPVDDLIPIITEKYGTKLPPDFSLLDYFVDNFEQNKSIWPVVKKVKRNCKVGLLTNMYVGMFEKIVEAKLLPLVKWDVIIDSSKIGMQKPDRKIYKFEQEKRGVENNEILFIDNSQKNIDAAKIFGWKTFLYDPSNHEESCRKISDFISLKIN